MNQHGPDGSIALRCGLISTQSNPARLNRKCSPTMRSIMIPTDSVWPNWTGSKLVLTHQCQSFRFWLITTRKPSPWPLNECSQNGPSILEAASDDALERDFGARFRRHRGSALRLTNSTADRVWLCSTALSIDLKMFFLRRWLMGQPCISRMRIMPWSLESMFCLMWCLPIFHLQNLLVLVEVKRVQLTPVRYELSSKTKINICSSCLCNPQRSRIHFEIHCLYFN